MANPFDQFDSVESGASNPFDQFDAAAKPAKKQGILGDLKDTLVEGTKSAGRSIAGAANVYTGNESGLVEKAKAQESAVKPVPLQGFYDEVKNRVEPLGEDPGLIDSIKAVGGAVANKPYGAGLAVVEQLPNAAPAIGGALLGAKGGAALGAFAGPVGAAVGGIAGGIAGMFIGNSAIETGYKGIEAAQDGSVTPEEFSRVKSEGAVKGGVITAVDAATLGLSKAVTSIPGRAVESATRKALTKAGVDVADEAAVLAARQSPEISAAVRAAQDSAFASANTIGKRAAAGGAALSLETVGEGLGEYLGELAATGRANVADAVLEGLMSLGQSGAEVAWGAARNKEQNKANTWDVAAQQERPAPTMTADPVPVQQRIDAMMGIDHEVMNDKDRAQYEKDLAAAFLEPVGFTNDANGLEIPFTMADYLNGQVRAADESRAQPLRQQAGQSADARLQQIADEESTQQPDISPAARGIAAAPVIPVVGPLSAVANMAVQSGAHAATVAQQAAAAAPAKAAVPQAGILSGVAEQVAPAAQKPAADPKILEKRAQSYYDTGSARVDEGYKEEGLHLMAQGDAILRGEQPKPYQPKETPNAASPAPVAKESPQANAPQVGAAAAAPVTAPADGDSFIRTRTDAQLNWLAERGKPEFKAAAAAEIQARAGQVSVAPEMPNGDGVTDQPTDTGIPMSVANQVPVKNASPTAATVPAEPVVQNQEPIKSAEQPASADPALQNRDRGRAASVNQMQSIARNPDYMRLGPSRTPDSGAPMVFAVGNDTQKISPANFGANDTAVMSDGQRVPFRYAVVDARSVEPSNFADGATNPAFSSDTPGTIKALNNGRTAGVRAAHEGNTAANYTAELLADQAHGVSPAAIRNTPNPMLVRVYAEQANTGDMAAKSQGQGLGMSASERATQDAELMTSDVLDKFAPGDIASAGNRDFVRAFVGKLAENELADMMDATGNLSQDGRRRIEAALLTAAYGKSDLVQELFESTDTDIKAIGNALKVMSGQWAAMRNAAKDGAIDPDADMTANLIEAVNIVRRSRAEGSSIAELAGQGDLMGGNYLNELSELFLRIFYKGKNYDRARGGDKVIAALQEVVTSAMNTKAEAGLFGDSFKATPKQIVESARSKIDEENKPASQAALFGANGQATAVSQGNNGEGAAQPGQVGPRPVSPSRSEKAGKQAEPVERSIADLQKELESAKFGERTELNGILIERVSKDAEQAIKQGEMPMYQTGQGTFVALHPSAQQDGMIQATRYSDTGVFGDSQYKEVKEAVRDNGLWFKRRLPDAEAARLLEQSIAAEAKYQERKNGTSEPVANSAEQSPAVDAGNASEMDALKAEMGQAIGELASILGVKSNLTPEEESKIIPVMSKIFRIAAKMGYIKFKDAAKYVLGQIRQLAGNEVADKISIDNLQAGYINIAKEIGGDKREAMSYDSIEDLEKANVIDQRSGPDLESDSGNAGIKDGLGEEGIRAGRDGNGGTGGPGVQGSEESLRSDSGSELRGSEAAAAGERGDLEIYTGATELSPGSAGNSVDSGSRDSGLAGAPVEPDAAKATRQSATGPNDLKEKVLAQTRADKNTPHKEGIEAIRAALPILTENQQDDVAKAEARFAVPDGYGMLFTNGTGTGKTFTGLGVIKRFANQGKKNILIVAPNDKIIEDWQKSGALLGLDLSRLADTNDAGKGIVITTYANMGQNNALASRDWDLVVHDEAHYLAMDKDGTNTNALKNLRAITLHPDGVFQRHNMQNAADIQKLAELDADAKMQRLSDDERNWYAAEKTQADADKLRNELKAKQESIKEDVTGRQGAKRTRALFLSATPFAYEKTVDWANGYIFDYNEGRGDESREFRGYNTGSNSDQFMMQHFGYRMRYGKLTQPDSKVDSGLMQRQFNSWLKKKGSLSGRMLDVAADYDRKFILVDSAIGQRIDAALEWFEVKRKAQHEGMGEAGERIGAIMAKADPYASALSAVRDHIGEKFDYLSRRYLLESIKAREVVPHIREHLALGRKIVVFHDYKKGGGFNPFILDERSVKAQEAEDGTVQAAEWNKVVREFNAEFRDIINSDLFKQSSPIDMFKQEFPDVLLFNGDVPQKQRRANVEKFQDDASGPQVILVQSAAGKEGISLHDTTGKHQRVLFNLGQPTQPTTAIQQEGRIYRTGQVTDALFRYLNTGTNWEKWAFATTIAQRASAAENLGMGEQARALKDAFISGFEESGDYRAGMENEGKGGKERDKAANDALTEYDRARAFYFGTQKKTSKTKAQEGADYFATPEPVGLKMVEWADIRPGEKVLEPSAGHGAIARWIPDSAEKTAIEPSMALRPRLAMVFDGQIIDSDFESLNVVNKFDAIVMNPPFGSGGKTAVDHLAKAATHLRDGGRIVALLPTGPAADKKFDKWMYGEEERAVKPIYEHPTLGAIYRGDTIQTNASWMKEGVITRKDKEGNLWFKREGATGESAVAYQAFKSVKPTGQRKAMFRPAEGLYTIADIKMPAVTFERAGTQVMTRIVVIEKSADPKAIDTRGVYNRDFTNAEDINDLFNRMEDMALPNRAKEVEQEAEEAPKPGRKAKPVVDTVATQAAAEKAGLEIIEHTTGKGKVLRGVVRTDLTQAQAKEIDEFTFKKDGGWFIREKHLVEQSGPGNITTPSKISPADKAIYGMAAEGKSAAEILKFIAASSRNPFYRQLAKLLQKTGIAPSVTVGDGKGWKFNAGEDNKYAAGYNPKTDTISLFRPASAERNMMHELVHAATLKALSGKGMAAAQMNALYQHVKKSGKLKGMYGMANLDEFVAEVFSNPKFQAMLKQVSAMPVGGKPSSAWDWFVRVIRGILGLKQGQDNALSQALDIGIGVMRENMKATAEASGDTRYATGPKQTESDAFRKWFSPDPTDVVSGLSKSVIDGLKANAQALADFLESSTVSSHLGGNLNIPRPVLLHMVEMVSNDKIRDAIVGAIPVDVVNFLGRKQLSAKEVLHNVTMLEDVLSVDPNSDVSLGVDPSTKPLLAVRVIANAGAKIAGLTGGPFKRNSTILADANDPVLGAHVRNSVNKDLSILRGFGDSKVVDANGEPLVVYHGTASDITAFDIGRSGESTGNTGFYGAGAYFSEDADYASGFSFWARRSDDQAPNVVPVYLSLKNPAYINITPRSQAASEKSRATAEKIISTMIARGTDQAVVDKLQGFVSENKFEPFMGTLYNALGGGTGTTALLKEAGFDGVTIYGGISGKEKLAEAVAFDPTQIKSAIGNNGDFDGSNPDIRYNAAPGKKSWSANDYQKRADQLDRAFAAMGLESVRESSRASASEYVKVNDPNDETMAYKLRISNHRLPSGYTQPDFDVIADGVEHDGVMLNASGTWIDAVNWIADKTGKEPTGIVKAMARKRRHEVEEAQRAEVVEREKIKAQYSDQNSRIIAEKIKLSDWLDSLPQESSLSVSNKGRLNATKPSGDVLQYGAKPFGMANSTKTIADARKYIESTPAPNSAATRLPGAPDKAGMQERSKTEPAQSKSGAGSDANVTDSADNGNGIRYNVADEGWSVSEQAKETVMRLAGRPMLDPSDPFAAENSRLREQDQSLWSKAKKQLRRYLAPGGLLPQSVFAEKIKRDSEFQAVEFDVRHLIGGLEQAVKADFGMAFDKLSKEQMRPITEALAGNVPASLPDATKTAAVAMRQYIDGMSTEYLKIIQQKIDAKMLKALESGKDADKAQAINEIELFEKIKGNIGRYVHRSYQAFDDPKWFEKVPAHVLNASRLYLKQGYMEAGETDAKAAQLAEVTLHEILKNGTAYDSMESFIAESKLGAKDLSVLMRRKEVPAQIRALLGEYQDARLNFTKSATKMGRLIWNTRFLDRVRDMGMGSFFFEGKDRPPNATTQIAADGSEVYAPLNGLWTFPETAQAFKDALGKEQMSDLYRAIVRANGLVKYGKTVLAPTTAMRNWQSAMFFSLANGHFDLTQMKKSISAFREQVSQTATGGDLKYLRHLKQLGVVYDTPYAGEMARLMEDARMEELLSSDKGDAVRWFRKVNQLAQGFYTFGDDFWKIIGFENEKAGLMKAGLSLQEAEIEAAKRIRDTYPTYSMVGRGVQWLSRFPLAGTFVSFPAEIIRTSANMLRTVAADLKSDNPKLRELGMKRAAGMVFVSAAFYSLAALSMAMAGVGDDEDEAIRDLAPEWQKNSTFLYLGRDEKGSLRYFDMSFLDPYGYWKRPITAMLRNQPWEDSLASGLRGMLEPFLGADISAKAIFEAVANKKESGSKVYKEKDGAIDQAVDIADHLRKALQPGVVSNVERLVKAAGDVRKSSGQPYSMEDELVALAGWRATTIDPKTALYYRSFDFTDSISEARKTLTDTLRDANSVSPEDIKDAKARAASKQEQAFKEMSRLIGAAEAAGMSKMQIVQTMRLSNISQANIAALMRGSTPDVSITPQLAARAVRQASQMRGPEYATEVFDRYRQAMAN